MLKCLTDENRTLNALGICPKNHNHLSHREVIMDSNQQSTVYLTIYLAVQCVCIVWQSMLHILWVIQMHIILKTLSVRKLSADIGWFKRSEISFNFFLHLCAFRMWWCILDHYRYLEIGRQLCGFYFWSSLYEDQSQVAILSQNRPFTLSLLTDAQIELGERLINSVKYYLQLKL